MSAAVNASVQVCDACGAEYDERDPRAECAACGGLLALRHPDPAQRGAELRGLFDARLAHAAPGHPADARGAVRISGVWRFRELVLPLEASRIVTKPEGNTNLYRSGAQIGRAHV